MSGQTNLNVIHARIGHGSLSKMKHMNFGGCKNLNVFFIVIMLCCKASQIASATQQ